SRAASLAADVRDSPVLDLRAQPLVRRGSAPGSSPERGSESLASGEAMKRFFAVWLAAVLFLLLFGEALGTSPLYLLTALVIGGTVSVGWLLWHVVCAAGSAAVSTGHALRDVGRAGANLHSARVQAIEAARLSDDQSRCAAARARCD